MDNQCKINIKACCHRILLVLVLIVLTFNVVAVKFYSVNTLFGISMRVTNSICKDDNGFIWASSKTGILRLTDDDSRIYQLPYETEGVLMVWLFYEKQVLTAYTNNGQVFRYNQVFDRFELVFNISKLLEIKDFDVFSVVADSNESYWIALNIGLYKFQEGRLEKVCETDKSRYELVNHQKSVMIVGSGGISEIDIQTLKKSDIFKIDKKDFQSVSSVFFEIKRNKMWIGTLSNGLFNYDFNTNQLISVLNSTIPQQPILDIEENSDSTLLIGIDGQGIWELSKTENRVINVYKESADDQNSLPGNGVYDIYCEPGKRVWVGTISGGVSFFDVGSPAVTQLMHHPNDENSLVSNDVNSILEDSSGKIWFATNNGISIWNPGIDKWKTLFNDKTKQAQVFLVLCEDVTGKIWAGSYSSGVYVLDSKTGNEIAHYYSGSSGSTLISNFIFDIFEDNEHNLWIGGVNGEFVCYKISENSFRSYFEESISSFAQLSPTQILIGQARGLKKLNKFSGNIEDLLSGIVVQDILVLNSEIWICTSGEGLIEYNFKTGKTKKYTTKEGLPSDFVNSIVYAKNYLWLGTENGLCRFDPRDRTIFTYATVSPLSSVSFNKSAATVLKDGQLAWGTSKGVVFFTPDSLKEAVIGGRIFFQDISVSGRSIRESASFNLSVPVDSLVKIELKYFQNNVSIELLPLDVTSGAKFSWKMEGFDEDWTTPSGNRIITYTNIPDGKFLISIKLFDSSLKQVLSVRSFEINVIPPFWRRDWFIVLVMASLMGIIVLLLLYYINKLKQKHTEEKVDFFTNTAHEIRTALTLIKAPVEELLHEKNLSENGKRYLQMAVKQARQLSSVVTQLMDFQKVDIGKEITSLVMVDVVALIFERKSIYESFASSKNIHIQIVANQKSYFTAIDVLKMEKIVDNLISNAIKYSHVNGKVRIEFKGEKGRWILLVKDDGIGISKKAQRKLFREFYRGDNAINAGIVGSGIGLLLVKKYVSMHGGTISFESQENVGSTFQIVIPLKEVAEKEPLVSEENIEQYSNADEYIEYDSEVIAENQSTKRMSILIVEDNEDLRNFIAAKVGEDFSVFVAENGEKAWELVLEHNPDLIVSDIMMPRKNGFELCELVKTTWETSHIPVILLTALTDKLRQMQGLGLGADDYLTKPFDIGLLIQKIKAIIRNREIVREKALKLIDKNASEPLLINEINDKFVKKLTEVVWENISNSGFDKEEFARAMNVSSSLLYKKTKSLTGQSPTDLIKVIRLSHASELLQTRKYRITEVSEMCGFSSVGYFSTVFKSYYGKSPSEILD